MKLILQCYALSFLLIAAGIICLFFTQELTPPEILHLIGLLFCICGLTFLIIICIVEDER